MHKQTCQRQTLLLQPPGSKLAFYRLSFLSCDVLRVQVAMHNQTWHRQRLSKSEESMQQVQHLWTDLVKLQAQAI